MRFPNPRYYGITDIENLTGTARRYQRLEFEDDVLYSTGSFSLEASYEPDSLNLITLSGWVDLQRTRESFRISERFWDADRNLTADMQEPRQMYNRGDSFSGELAYQRTFLGDGGVGKSYTIRRIRNGCKKADYQTEQTPGVEILDYTVPKDGDDYTIHFWDFGGQEILHSMHRCFLTDQTCYVVTVRTRDDAN